MRYTESHEWIEEGKNPVKVGITQYAQKELGDIVYVELPAIGAHVGKGKEAVVLESTKAAADVYAPCSGKIIDVNLALNENPSLVNTSPQDKGWLYLIELSEPSELNDLLDENAYNEMIE
ncbi:glycine cleavage system protein GcvH [Chlamydiales bacterium]|nr:glycine cleavage system protein GcvH [Chlamydiales bacterium]